MTIIAPPTITNDDDATLVARIKLLPPLAKSKIKAKQKAQREARAQIAADYEHRKKRSDEHQEIVVRITKLQSHKDGHGPWDEDNEEELRDLITERDEIAAELRAANREMPIIKPTREQRKRNEVLYTLNPDWRDYLCRTSALTRFVERRVDLPKLGRGKTLLDALAETRAAQDEQVTKLVNIDDALLDLDTVLTAMRREVAKLAAQGQPNIAGLWYFMTRDSSGRKRQGSIRWPEDTLFTPGMNDSGKVQLGNAMLAWLFQPQLEARFEAEIRARLETNTCMSVADREAADKELRAQFLELQRVESRICSELQKQGVSFEERPLHPLAWLEIDFGEPAKLKDRNIAVKGNLREPLGTLVG